MTSEQQIKQAINQGQFSTAIEFSKQAISAASTQAERVSYMYMLAVAFRMQGDALKAIETNHDILKLQANHARAHQELGYAYRSIDKQLDSAKHFYQATQINPALLASWKALLSHYQHTENAEACRLAQAQIDYLNALPKQVMHGRDLFHEGQLHLADQLCRRFLQTNKHDPDAMLLLAEIGIALKVYSEAEFLLESCLELHPEHKAAGIEYLKLLSKMGRFEAARECADKLLQTHPKHPPILAAKASAMLGLGETKKAIALYKQLLDKTPGQSSIHLLLGHAYKADGQIEAAIRAYQNAYQCKEDFGDAYWSLANTKTYAFTDVELTKMQDLLSQDISSDEKIHLHFALGKAFEDKKAYSSSFHYYQQGNALKQAQLAYQPDLFEKQVSNHKQVFTQALFKRFAQCGDKHPDPIFIVGLPRAGSTLLEQILASHSKVDGTMELHNILSLAARLSSKNQAYPELLNSLDPTYFERFGQQYLQDTKAYRDQAPFFIDKMPNNFLHIGLIKLILPNAKVIDARREPMACCFSGFKQLFAEGQEFSYGLEDIGRYYAAYVDMMTHWDAVLPNFVLRVQHEDVIEDLEGQVKRILKFCGLEFEQACLDFHKTKRTIKTPSSEQVRQPIFKDSMQQWKHFEKDLQALKKIVEPFMS